MKILSVCKILRLCSDKKVCFTSETTVKTRNRIPISKDEIIDQRTTISNQTSNSTTRSSFRHKQFSEKHEKQLTSKQSKLVAEGKQKQSSWIQTILGKIKIKSRVQNFKIWENSGSCNNFKAKPSASTMINAKCNA